MLAKVPRFTIQFELIDACTRAYSMLSHGWGGRLPFCWRGAAKASGFFFGASVSDKGAPTSDIQTEVL